MRFVSICDGIGAAVHAWEPLGWRCAWRSEIDPFCVSVAAARYPHAPNLGDMTQITDAQIAENGPIDVLVGGTPCQSFSVAGLRRGMEDDRGKLAVEFIELARRTEARYVVWENVPGVLSDRSNAFGCFLAGLVGSREPIGAGVDKWKWRHAGCVDGPEGSAVWRVLDAQYFGLAQRRKRVFVVFCPRSTGIDPAEVLFEREGVRRDTPPSRETREVASAVALKGASLYRNPEKGHPRLDALDDGTCYALVTEKSHGVTSAPEVANTLTARMHKGINTTLDEGQTPIVCFDETQITSKANRSNPQPGDPSHPLTGSGLPPTGILPTGVRRLTPRECERLQGFPDDWTLVEHRGKPAADTPRYKALGNSMAVPVMRWIGSRIRLDGE